MTTIELTIEGMTCASCSARLERQLNKQVGIQSAVVNLASERAIIAFNQAVITQAQLLEVVKKTGFSATPALSGLKQQQQALQKEQSLARQEIRLLMISVLLTLPLVLPMLLWLFNISWQLNASIQMLLASLVQFGIGWRFYIGAFKSIKGGAGNMDVLVALGTSAAWGLSVWTMIIGKTEALYFESSAMVITLILLGKLLERRSKRQAGSAIRALMSLQADNARIEKDGEIIEIPTATVRLGDIMLIRPAEKVPLDGVIIKGESDFDESMLTGESRPVFKTMGADIIGGSLNGEMAIKAKVTKIAGDATLARIIKMVEKAQSAKAPIQKLVDQIAAVFVPVVVIIALFTFMGWYISGDTEHAFINMISVLVIACPCALGLATPTALMVGMGVAAKQGILIRDMQALEKAHLLKVILFDKTGTLTQGKPEIKTILSFIGKDKNALLQQLASIQQASEHPLAKAIVKQAKKQQLILSHPEKLTLIGGKGVLAEMAGKKIIIGNQALMSDYQINPITDLKAVQKAEKAGETLVFISDIESKQALGFISLIDQIKPETQQAIQKLQQMGLKTGMLTGDNQAAALKIAEQLNLDEVWAELLPQDKIKKIQYYQQQNIAVAMVGDGVNDAPALAGADIGMAMDSGSDAAMEAADITLMRSDPLLIPAALAISKATRDKIRQNLFWAFIYNIIAIPLAISGALNPMLAGAAMAMSSVSVVSNSLMLKRYAG